MQYPQQPAWPQAQAYPPPAPAYPQAHAAPAYPQPTPAYPAPGHAPYAAPSHAPYEFGPEQNRVIERLSARIQGFGMVSIVLGVLSIIGGVVLLFSSPVVGIGRAVGAIVPIVTGIIYTRGAARLRDVVKTSGDDIAHLMAAMDELGKAFLIQLVMVAIGFVAGFLFAGF